MYIYIYTYILFTINIYILACMYAYCIYIEQPSMYIYNIHANKNIGLIFIHSLVKPNELTSFHKSLF